MKTAYIFSGGGAKGSFQYGVMSVIHKTPAYLYSGISVGALNAALYASEKDPGELWYNIKESNVLSGKQKSKTLEYLRYAKRLLTGKNYIYSNAPLLDLIRDNFNPEEIRHKLLFGSVMFNTGEYVEFYKGSLPGEELQKALLSSTAIPIIWKPVDINSELTNMVDGGLYNLAPIASAIDHDPEEIIIILCGRTDNINQNTDKLNMIETITHTIDVMTTNALKKDLKMATTINRLLDTLDIKKKDGTPYKQYNFYLIQPDREIGGTLDFEKSTIEEWISHGKEVGTRFLENKDEYKLI